ncbi:MAG TPA: hypothetical protein VMM38_02600 [Aridibacter sp.]|nr:hypothetical protein [Aridibacter sp.]
MKNETVNLETAIKILDFPARDKRDGYTGADSPELPSLESVFGPLGERSDWSYRITSAKFLNGYAVVVASLRLAGFEREGLGISPAELEGSLEQAERRALADAVSKFAFRQPEPRERIPDGFERDKGASCIVSGPEAVSLRDMISYSQLSRAKSLAKQLLVSADDEAERQFGCALSELSREAADELIESLESRASGPRRFRRAG